MKHTSLIVLGLLVFGVGCNKPPERPLMKGGADFRPERTGEKTEVGEEDDGAGESGGAVGSPKIGVPKVGETGGPETGAPKVGEVGMPPMKDELPNDGKPHANPDPSKGTLGKVVGGYFVEWGVYGRMYPIDNVPFNKLTHFIYSFLPICGDNPSYQEANPSGWALLQTECMGKKKYEIAMADSSAALGMQHNSYKKMEAAKAANPGVKFLPSIGGWTMSDAFFGMASSEANRKVFIDSCIAFLKTYPFFDGIDIDWEYPGGGGAAGAKLADPVKDKVNHLNLMKELRTALDTLGTQTNRKYLITSAVGAGPTPIQNIDYKAIYADPKRPLIDLIFDMTYDYFGGWNGHRAAQAGLYPGKEAHTRGFSIAETIANMKAAGVPTKHIVLGIGSYGRAWKNAPEANKGLTTAATLKADEALSSQQMDKLPGMWEAGILDYKMIAGMKGSGGWEYFYDNYSKTPYLFDKAGGRLISYDDACSVQLKIDFATEQSLGGSFMWELDADTSDYALLNVMNGTKPSGCPK